MTTREEKEVALDRRLSRLDANARDAGHRLDDWTYETTGDALVASVRCRECGLNAFVRVEGTKKEMIELEAGKLRYEPCANGGDEK